ncbi:MAG: HNH endonuclease [Fibrobacteria bacterium]|nr:HNH endonuclease [Fibrobacteria bacterium]
MANPRSTPLPMGALSPRSSRRASCALGMAWASFPLAGCSQVKPFDDPPGQRVRLELPIAAESSEGTYQRSAWMPDGTWIHPLGDSCLDTRGMVLLEESSSPVRMTPDGCRVDSGTWTSPYSGTTERDASQLDIDHLVPLAEAHRSGGMTWDSAMRRLYANDLSHPEHLVAVDRSSNRSKGDRDPARWMPPLRESWCSYLRDWATIKRRWHLSMDSVEYHFVGRGLDSCAASGMIGMPLLSILPPSSTFEATP